MQKYDMSNNLLDKKFRQKPNKLFIMLYYLLASNSFKNPM